MKKILAICLFQVVATLLYLFPVLAYQPIGIDIWTKIDNGGTVEISAGVNCPLPDKSSITVKDKKSKAFHVEFNTVGDYSYTIKVAKDGSKIKFDDTVYTVKCYVRDDNGKLVVTTIIYNDNTGKKYEPDDSMHDLSVGFKNLKGSPNKGGKVSDKDKKKKNYPINEKGDSNKIVGSRPKTGDDGMLDLYLIICILASGGLFALSISYYRACSVKIVK